MTDGSRFDVYLANAVKKITYADLIKPKKKAVNNYIYIKNKAAA